jgi:hypothetical protein
MPWVGNEQEYKAKSEQLNQPGCFSKVPVETKKPLYRAPARGQCIHAHLEVSLVQRYANLSGDSGVRAYRLDADSITVEFADGRRYLYTNESAGADNVEHMKQLAARGQGLSGFISTTVRNGYAKRW